MYSILLLENKEGEAKKVSEQITGQMSKASGAFGGSLKGIVEKYNTSAKEKVDAITTDASEFQAHMKTSLDQQKTKVAEGFQTSVTNLKVVFEDWRSNSTRSRAKF